MPGIGWHQIVVAAVYVVCGKEIFTLKSEFGNQYPLISSHAPIRSTIVIALRGTKMHKELELSLHYAKFKWLFLLVRTPQKRLLE